MSKENYVFVQKYNALKGCIEWCPAREDYDYQQEVARSAYADMLHDRQRNLLYRFAIDKMVEKLLKSRPKDEKIRVVDIGTGTGLLSLLAARAFGKDINRCEVTAFECFLPMADCAEKVIERNGYSGVIKVVKKRSTQDENLPLNERADLLITEVFDTELIGEGALGTYRYALKNQVKPGALAVPSKARIWVQLISSKWLQTGNNFFEPHLKNGTKISLPKCIRECSGSNHLHDLQLNQVKLDKDIKLVSSPKILFEFNFVDINTLPLQDEKVLQFEIKDNVDGHLMIAMWWDLFMDEDNQFLLSCAPYWAYPTGPQGWRWWIPDDPWRDHWIQSIYYLPANLEPFKLEPGDKIDIKGYHDEYSLWFDVANDKSLKYSPNCTCGLHSHIIRSRLRMMNNSDRLTDYCEAIEKCDPKSVLFIGDASFVPFMISKTFKDVNLYCLTKDKHSILFYEEFMQCNGSKLNIVSDVQCLQNEKFDLIVAEPYFNSINLPWDTLHFWYILTQIPKTSYDAKNIKFVPRKAEIEAIAVEFDDLWKIRSEVGEYEQINLKDFDDLVINAMNKSDASIESQPLWEYPSIALQDKPFTVFEWDFSNLDLTAQNREMNAIIKVDKSLLRHEKNTVSLVLWMKFYLTEDKVITTGPVSDIKMGEPISWDREWKQGVSFLFTHVKDKRETDDSSIIFDLKFNYNFNDGELNLNIH